MEPASSYAPWKGARILKRPIAPRTPACGTEAEPLPGCSASLDPGLPSSHASGVRFLGITVFQGLRSLRSLNPRLFSLHASGVQFVPLDVPAWPFLLHPVEAIVTFW